ncbi:hypothetical protein pb186bvf_000295 [Paramecium bursaria]
MQLGKIHTTQTLQYIINIIQLLIKFEILETRTKIVKMNQNIQRPKLFLSKLKKILQNSALNHCIRWDEDGDKILLENKNYFILEVLPKYFRHNNYNSFLRQLNKYKFRLSKNKDQKIELYHKDFQRDSIKVHLFQLNNRKARYNFQEQLQVLRNQILQLHLNQKYLKQQMEKITQQMSLFYKIMSLLANMNVKQYVSGWRNGNSLARFYLLFCRGINNEFFKQQILEVFDQALNDSQLVIHLNSSKYRGYLQKLSNWETEVLKLNFEFPIKPLYQIYRMSPVHVLFQNNKNQKMLGYLSEDDYE